MNLLTRIITFKDRLKLSLLEDEITDLSADLLLTDPGSEAHAALLATLEREEASAKATAERLRARLGCEATATPFESIIFGICLAAVVGTASTLASAALRAS